MRTYLGVSVAIVGAVLLASLLCPTAPSVRRAPVPPSAALTAASLAHPIRHAVVIVLENEELSTVLKYGPYEHYLSDTFGDATLAFGICHGAGDQEMALTSGRDVGCPSALGSKVYDVANIADVFDAHRLHWMGYMESMPSPCYTGSSGLYNENHNPFIHYTDIRANSARCKAHVVGGAVFNTNVSTASLPEFSLYIPNMCDDGHNLCVTCPSTLTTKACETRQADKWLKGFLAPILNGSAVASNTAFFLVYDEGTTKLGYARAGDPTNQGCIDQTGIALTACGGKVWMTVVSPDSRLGRYGADTTQVQIQSTVEWLFAIGNGSTSPDGGWDGTSAFPPMTSLFGV